MLTPEAKDPRAEWRVFVPVPSAVQSVAFLGTEVLGGDYDGPYDKREGDGIEGRSDIYIAVNDDIGLKRRGTKGRVELKVRTDIVKEGNIKGIEHWRKYKIGKGLPEEETLAQLAQILKDHNLIDDHVTSLLAAEDGSKSVEVAKQRVEKAYDEHGVHTEQCLVEVGIVGTDKKQWRSWAVEGEQEKVIAFLSSHPVGQKMYAHTQEEGAVLHGYPGFVCACLP